MINNSFIDELAQKICNAMPDNLKNMKEDAKTQMKSCVQSALQSMDIVSREEFDVQVKVLQKTREKLESLEKQLDALK